VALLQTPNPPYLVNLNFENEPNFDNIEKSGQIGSNVDMSRNNKDDDDDDDDDERKRKIPDSLHGNANPSKKKREVAHKVQSERVGIL